MPTSEKKQRELDYLRRVLLAFAVFDRSHLGSLTDLMVEGIEQEYKAGRLSGLREALNDSIENVADLTGAELRELGGVLRDQAGVSLGDLLRKRNKKLAEIQARGRITTETQYRLVMARINVVYADPAYSAEVGEWNRLLTAYEKEEALRV